MKFRNIKDTSRGRWLDILWTAADEFSVSQETHRQEVATSWGIPSDHLAVEDDDEDQRIGVLVPAPAPTAPRPDSDLPAYTAATLAGKVDILARRAGIIKEGP